MEPIFFYFKQRRRDGETLGDFTARVGFKSLRAYAESYVSEEEAKSLPQVR